MIYINTQRAIKQFEGFRQQLGSRRFNQAIYRALNESILSGRTQARLSVKSIYNIPQRYLAGVNVIKATSVSLSAKLYASATPIPMDAFSPKFETSTKALSITKRGQQKARSFKKAKSNPTAGVSVEVVKGQRMIVPIAFLIEGGKPRVFARGEYRNGTSFGFVSRNKRVNKTGSDIPIKPLVSVSVHGAVINKKALTMIENKVSAVFPVSLERNVSFLINQLPSG